MGLVKFGGGVAGISGKVGGSVYAKNKSGSYVRNWAKPVNPNTSRQQQARNNLSAMAEYWSGTLTAAQRTAWDLYASNVPVLNRLGESINLSGFNMFCRSNAAILAVGGDVVPDGPTIFSLPEEDPTMSAAISAASQEISVSFDDSLAWANEEGGYLSVQVGQPQIASKSFFAAPYRYAGKVEGDGATPPTSPAAIALPYVVSAGQKVWVKVRVIRADGRISEPFQRIITAAS